MKSCRFFWPKAAALFAAIVLSSPVFAAQSLPDKMAALVQTVYETAQSNDGNWIFVNAESAADGKNRLYSFDNKSGEARVLFEPFPDTKLRFVYGIHFWPKTQKLYFMVHCGQYEKNATRNLFLHEGLYTAQMDSEQNYSARGVWRQSVLEGWLLKNLWTAYIQKAQGISDYKEFLSALSAFADPGTNPVFALPAKNGAALYGTDALEWMVQNKKEKEFLEQADGALVFPLEKYLLCRDDGGNVLQKSAVTTRERNLNNKNAGMIWTETTFAEANQSLYCVLMKGSFKNENLPTQEWTWDYSLVFEIQDDQSGISFFVPEPLKDIRAATYPFGASDQPPIQGTKDGLLIRDIDGKTKWLYDGNNAARHSKLRLGAAALKSGSAAAWLWLVCAGLGLALLLLLILFCQFSRGRFSFSWQRKIVYRIQEEERNKISRDIHDSIVQDIRAIRIEAEMLKLAAGEEQKQKDLTAKITDCIVKMRNICYGLAPAELSLAASDFGKVNFLSILNSLCEQFEAKTRVKCSLNNEKSLDEILVEKEKCQNLVRIAQEALANIEKHSYATEAQILARTEIQQGKNILTLFIIDNGRGCDLDKTLKSGKTHFGLRQMKERAKTIGAQISFRSAPDDGMQIKLSVEI